MRRHTSAVPTARQIPTANWVKAAGQDKRPDFGDGWALARLCATGSSDRRELYPESVWGSVDQCVEGVYTAMGRGYWTSGPGAR